MCINNVHKKYLTLSVSLFINYVYVHRRMYSIQIHINFKISKNSWFYYVWHCQGYIIHISIQVLKALCFMHNSFFLLIESNQCLRDNFVNCINALSGLWNYDSCSISSGNKLIFLSLHIANMYLKSNIRIPPFICQWIKQKFDTKS